MLIKNIEFIKSSNSIIECPKDKLPEFAFLGRSNVGKSSLINMIVNNKKLSKTSSKPGKTRLINHFRVDKKFYLVDLPGYGWAKASKADRKKWDHMVKEYVTKSNVIVVLFILIDIRLKPQDIDISFLNYYGKKNIPINIIFTKCDKINSQNINKNINTFFNELSKSWSEPPEYFVTSSIKKIGKIDITGHIESIYSSFKNYEKNL